MMDTKQKVILAAKEVFISKGYEGAKMQEIADQAEINKGLLHYYYKSKENLFRAVIKDVAGQVVPELGLLLENEDPIPEKIRLFVGFYIDLLIENPYLPAFVLSEINLKGDIFIKEIMQEYSINPMKLFMQLQMEIQQGKIRDINPFDLLINILSMCIFPFIARPIFKNVAGLSEEDYLKFMQTRKKEIVTFTIQAIQPTIYPNG